MKRKAISADRVVSLSAMFISLCTLGVFIYQTKLIRQQQYMSVYPYLSVSNGWDTLGNFRLMITNTGIGPALIEQVDITDPEDESFSGIVFYLNDELEEAGADTINYVYSNLWPGRMIAAGEVVEVITMKNNSYEVSHIVKNLLYQPETTLKIRYSSIYGESWLLSSESKMPIPKKL